MNIKKLANGDVAFVILVKPSQKKETLVLADDGSMVLRVNAPATEGKANARVIELLSKVLKRPKRDITIARGEVSRHKEIRVRDSGGGEDVIKALREFLNASGEFK